MRPILPLLGMSAIVLMANVSHAETPLEQMIAKSPLTFIQDEQARATQPLSADIRRRLFADFLVTSLDTYTPSLVRPRMEALMPFMDTRLRADAMPYMQARVKRATEEQRTSVFLPLKGGYQDLGTEKQGQVAIYRLAVPGRITSLISNTVAGSVAVNVNMGLREVPVTAQNPFGYLLAEYRENPLAQSANVSNRP